MKFSIGPLTLFVLFLALKLSGVITWPYIWVTAPLWIPVLSGVALLISAAAVVVPLLAVVGAITVWEERRGK